MKPFTNSPPFLTYASMTRQLTQSLLIALAFLAGSAQAQAEISLIDFEGTILLEGNGTTNRSWSTDASDFLDPAYAKWAWNNLKSFEELSDELGKHEEAYIAWEKASNNLFEKNVRATLKKAPFLKRTQAKVGLRTQVDREAFSASSHQEAVAKFRDLTLLRTAWNIAFEKSTPFDAENWRAYEVFYCDRHTKEFNFRMKDCRIPNWRRPDVPQAYKAMYERRKKEGTLKYLQTN
ncbi:MULTISPECIES: hypothetical protein [unclassified Pseudovibrio]|uniref:hypothetical protein n=1 Tax=unclassified Pseudovibrio TaxID=2627060 RepID=UPI0007AE89F4|nr:MULTISPECIES: hypothetical protein [unclassified Pseudovibrio]